MKKEEKLKSEIKKYLDSLGAYWFMPVQTGYGVSGTPDFLCCIQGRFVGVEAKAPGKTPSPWQKKRIEEINKAGGVAFATDSLERTITYIEDHVLGKYP